MLGDVLREARMLQEFKSRELAAEAGIDAALISKFEKGDRMPTEVQLMRLSELLSLDFKSLKTEWLADKIVKVVGYEMEAREALYLAESRIEYLVANRTFEVPELSGEIKEKLNLADKLRQRWQSNKPLDGMQLSKMKEYFQIENTYESNRIEGNTLTLQETQLVVNEGLTIGGKSMREHLEAVNHADALAFLEELLGTYDPLNKRTVLDLHRLILKGVDTKHAGIYRSVPVRISGSRHEPPQPYLLDSLMQDFFNYLTQNKKRLHPIILAAEVHERLVSIHPFIDGNGRTSRLLMNLVLLSNGYTLATLKGDNVSRLAYYRALEAVQVDNNPGPFFTLVADAAIHSLEEHLKLV